tara:strand:+ start:1576 stop:2163 length:588 start_codon:yes stop_codon:yes gene_type:complete
LEKEKMELTKYIKIYDNVIKDEINSSFLHYARKVKDYEDSFVLGEDSTTFKVDKQVRNTTIKPLMQNSSSLTNIHWYSYWHSKIKEKVLEYVDELNIIKIPLENINSIAILKYEKGGYYKFHTDHCRAEPRTLSFIYFLNDDYEGGDLLFKLDGIDHKVEKKQNRAILWPSNFMYPHTVTPVESGVRYSLVSWIV